MNDLLTFWTPETTFSLIFTVIFIGGGIWFNRSFWPWITSYLNRKLDLEHQRELAHVELELENERRWREVTTSMIKTVTDFKVELVALRTVIEQLNKQNEMIYRMFARLNEERNSEHSTG